MRAPAIVIASLWVAACQPAPVSRSGELSPPPPEISGRCLGTSQPRCVVYSPGRVVDHTIDWDRGLFYQLQGTGLPGSGEGEYCKGGYCAVAIIKQDESGHLHLGAHVESADAQWFEVPEIVLSDVGPLVVSRSNSLGTGLYNDDVVLREDETGKLRRIDVNSWKQEAGQLAPDANSYFDWTTDYGAFVGSNGLASTDANESARASVGAIKVFLHLDGDTLKIASSMVRFPDRSAR
ncbi:hypothetical protein BH09PSE1_BH09PSE1_25180 [soil metagenome]